MLELWGENSFCDKAHVPWHILVTSMPGACLFPQPHLQSRLTLHSMMQSYWMASSFPKSPIHHFCDLLKVFSSAWSMASNHYCLVVTSCSSLSNVISSPKPSSTSLPPSPLFPLYTLDTFPQFYQCGNVICVLIYFWNVVLLCSSYWLRAPFAAKSGRELLLFLL